MEKKRIVITGLGVLTSNGIGKDNYWQSLKHGKSGIKEISLFDVSNLKVKVAGEISDFDAKEYLGQKGLRSLDRSTKLICSAAKLAIDDSALTITEENTNDIGVVVGTTLGSVYSISEFDKEALREGPRYVNPAAFPNTVINSPASQVSIKFNIKGFNTTISTGFTASLDAIGYAIDFLNLDRAKVIFAGGVEESCIQTFLGFYKIGFLSGSKDGQLPINCPFDKRRNGIVFGEGAVFLVLEELGHALERGANILAEISDFSSSFDPYRLNKYNPRGDGIKKTMHDIFQHSSLKTKNIDYISANANSTQKADKIETDAIKEVFGPLAKKVPVSAIKSMTGECFSVSAALQAAAAVGSINEGFIPATINYKEKDPECDLDYVPNEARQKEVKNVLINSFGPSANNTCLIIKRYER